MPRAPPSVSHSGTHCSSHKSSCPLQAQQQQQSSGKGFFVSAVSLHLTYRHRHCIASARRITRPLPLVASVCASAPSTSGPSLKSAASALRPARPLRRKVVVWVLATGLVCPSLSQSSRLSATTRVRVCAPLRQKGHRHHQRALYGSGQHWTGLSSREHQKVRSRRYGCASHRSVCARPLWSQGTHFIIHSTRNRREIARRLIRLR